MGDMCAVAYNSGWRLTAATRVNRMGVLWFRVRCNDAHYHRSRNSHFIAASLSVYCGESIPRHPSVTKWCKQNADFRHSQLLMCACAFIWEGVLLFKYPAGKRFPVIHLLFWARAYWQWCRGKYNFVQRVM